MTHAKVLAAVAIPAMLLTGLASSASAADNDPKPVMPTAQDSPFGTTTFGSSVSVPVGTNGVATATCPADSAPLSGGGDTSGIRIFLTDSFATGTGWTVRGTNTGAGAESLRAYVLCAAR